MLQHLQACVKLYKTIEVVQWAERSDVICVNRLSKAIVWARLVVQLDAVIVSLKVRAFIFLKMKNVSPSG